MLILQNSIMGNETKGMILGILGVICFGLTLPATRFVISFFDPIFIGLGRAVIASLIAVLFLIFSNSNIPSLQQFYQLFGVAGGIVLGFPILSACAMQTVPASHGGVLLGIMPLATAIVGALVSNERPSFSFWLFGIIGSIIVVIFALLQGFGSFQKGDFFLVGAIISASIGYAVGGKLSKEIGGWQVICWALVISFPFIIVPTVLKIPEVPIDGFPTNVIISFLYLALVSQFFGFFLWYKGLALGGIARVSQTMLLQPFVTLFASALLLFESITFETIIFTLLIVVTVAIGKKMPIY